MVEAKASSRVFLLSSLALGVLAMAAAFVFLQNTAGQGQGPKVTILVAKHDLRENTQLDPARDFSELEIPQRFTGLQSLALQPQLVSTYKGQRLNRTVLAGQPIMLADLSAVGSLELHGQSLAMSVPVKGVNALGGLIAPGDYVKLMVTRPTPASRFGLAMAVATGAAGASGASSATTRPVSGPSEPPAPPPPPPAPKPFETVLVSPAPFRVLAVNQRLSRARPQVTAADAYQSAGDANGNQTVTLEVTEAQAKNILEQTGAGQLPVTLLLCPPGAAGH